jgi:hypothetical protein
MIDAGRVDFSFKREFSKHEYDSVVEVSELLNSHKQSLSFLSRVY